MTYSKSARVSLLVLSGLLLTACAHQPAPDTEASADQVSKPGVYEGYAEVLYDGHERTSLYAPVRDGTKLAIDIFRPTLNGEAVTTKLPVVWMHTPYNRRTFMGKPAVEAYPGYALQLVKYGYNVAIVDFRGLYASHGANKGFNRGEWLPEARWDSYDITEWLADQPFSDGNIGMWGCSATGGSQMQTLTTSPPSLKAIIPLSAEYDAYSFAVLGGVARERPIGPPGMKTGPAMIAARDKMAVPIDGDDDRSLLSAAQADHNKNMDSVGMVPFSDSRSDAVDQEWWALSSPHTYASAMKDSHIGVYAVANWDEAGTRHGTFLTFNNLNPDNTKMLVGPASHCDWSTVKKDTGFDLVTEELRFFDHWLKGVDNGVMDEPPVTYYTYNQTPEASWSQSDAWPLKSEVREAYFLSGQSALSQEKGTSLSIRSNIVAPPKSETVTVFTPEDGVKFETAPLASDTEITGHPTLDLWIQSPAENMDVTAILYDVAPDGSKQTHQFIGRIRASHRALGEAPYENLGLPWHSFKQADAKPLEANTPARIQFEMLPMSYIFKAGHKIQVQFTLASADEKIIGQPVQILTGGDHASSINLPLIAQQ